MFKLKRKRRRSIWGLIFLLSLWSCIWGWGLSQIQTSVAMETSPLAQTSESLPQTESVGGVDVVPPQLKQGEKLYQQRCGTCHIALPPQVLPSQTWQALLPDSNHYGLVLPPFRNPELTQTWEYVSFFSRQMKENELRPIPYRVNRSEFFKILHPNVDFAEPVTADTCVRCHPGVSQLNFRQLSPEWTQ